MTSPIAIFEAVLGTCRKRHPTAQKFIARRRHLGHHTLRRASARRVRVKRWETGAVELQEAHATVDAIFSGKAAGTSLPPYAIENFKNSLKFSNGRLVHADYEDLHENIPKEQIKDMFLKLGVSSEEFDANGFSRCTGTPPICFPGPGFCDPGDCDRA